MSKSPIPDIGKLSLEAPSETSAKSMDEILGRLSYEKLIRYLNELEEGALAEVDTNPVDKQAAIDELASALEEIKESGDFNILEEEYPELAQIAMGQEPEEGFSEGLSEEEEEEPEEEEEEEPYVPVQPRKFATIRPSGYAPIQTRAYLPVASSRAYAPVSPAKTYAPTKGGSDQAVNFLASHRLDELREALRSLGPYGVAYKPGRSKVSAAEAIINGLQGLSKQQVANLSPLLSQAYQKL